MPIKMTIRKILFAIAATFCASGIICAQEAQVASGGNAAGSGGTVSWSAGQACCSTITGSAGSAAAGVQQPFEISIVNGARLPDITLTCAIFPNPTAGRLVLATGGETGTFAAILYDQHGRLLNTYKVTGPEVVIDLGSLAPAPYFLKVTRNGRPVKTFKIIRQ
jgi:hypothetical protein